MRKTLIFLLFASIFLVSMFFFSSYNDLSIKGEPSTIYVPTDYSTIQEAIDNANENDIIYINSGTYNENIQINKDLTITGENKDTTIIDGGNSDHVIKIEGVRFSEIEVQISDLNIKNAGGTGKDCIAVSYVKDSIINNNIISNSETGDGIGIDHSTSISVYENTIKNNNNGAGISLIADSTDNEIYNNIIQYNKNGIYIYKSSNNNIIRDNTISYNNQYGVDISSQTSSTGNYFYQNIIKSNSQNANDPHINYWDYNSQGNYWGDYEGYDSDNNQIGDTPYNIPGGNNKDNFPLGYFSTQKPSAYITSISPNPATEGDTVNFVGMGTPADEISSVEWKINGNIMSELEEFSYSSFSPGSHSVYFRVKNFNEEWSSYDQETLIVNQDKNGGSQDNQIPSATITSPSSSSITKNYGDKITFSGYGSDQDGTITGYKWESSIDGVISTLDNFYKSDLSFGTHTIYFKVKDNMDEWSDPDAITVEIKQDRTPGENIAPVAIPGGIYSGNASQKITFNGSGSYDTDGTITSYEWDFGNGENETGMIVEHTYEESGEYNVILTVTDNMGEKSSSSTIAEIDKKSGDDKLVIPGFEIIIFMIGLSIIIAFKKYKN